MLHKSRFLRWPVLCKIVRIQLLFPGCMDEAYIPDNENLMINQNAEFSIKSVKILMLATECLNADQKPITPNMAAY
uniref:Non-specific serine/threonine protein kinase n=1 Tax=Romanomermis culicivorax TaxID=13658 RepID=A0A915KVI7_ROMCU